MSQTPTGPKLDDSRRLELAGAFQSGGELYDRVRPGYPSGAARWLIPEHAGAVVDLGAGTGKFTERLVEHGLRITAVDPSQNMLDQLAARLPRVATVRGTAEQTGLPDSSADAVFVAQAWHWFDQESASAEIARVLRPGGTLGLIWNQLDVRIPWVHRLSRIMHAGDVHDENHVPLIGTQFEAAEPHLTRWSQPLTPEGLIELVKSRSYYLRAGEADRARVRNNMDWYLFEHLGHQPAKPIDLPYLSIAWRARKR